MSKPITQTEAKRLRKQVRELQLKVEQITNAYSRDYPGTYITTFIGSDVLNARLDVVKRLGHTIVARQSGNEVHLYAAEKTA